MAIRATVKCCDLFGFHLPVKLLHMTLCCLFPKKLRYQLITCGLSVSCFSLVARRSCFTLSNALLKSIANGRTASQFGSSRYSLIMCCIATKAFELLPPCLYANWVALWFCSTVSRTWVLYTHFSKARAVTGWYWYPDNLICF